MRFLKIIMFCLLTLMVLVALLLTAGCGIPPLKLNPLLVEYHNNKELSDEEVDIRIERAGFLETQVMCIKTDPLLLLLVPILGCAVMTCEGKKLWETSKHCTCQIWLWVEYSLDEEIKHCRGWEDVFY